LHDHSPFHRFVPRYWLGCGRHTSGMATCTVSLESGFVLG
jgi:hypothetical protein